MNMVAVTFPAGTVTVGANECVVVTGVTDSNAEGTEVLGFTIDESMPSLYTVDGTADAVTETARVFVVDDDGKYNERGRGRVRDCGLINTLW